MEEKSRPRSSAFSSAQYDHLYVKKATASASHQRSSSHELFSDEYPTAKLCPRRPHLRHPSRYHIEALPSPAAADLSKKPESQSSLLDFFEIEIINRELERFIILAGADQNDEAGGRRGKGVGRWAADLSGFRKFLARKAVAFCGSDGTVVPERRHPAAVAAGWLVEEVNYVNW